MQSYSLTLLALHVKVSLQTGMPATKGCRESTCSTSESTIVDMYSINKRPVCNLLPMLAPPLIWPLDHLLFRVFALLLSIIVLALVNMLVVMRGLGSKVFSDGTYIKRPGKCIMQGRAPPLLTSNAPLIIGPVG